MLIDLASSLPAGWFTTTLSNPGQPCGFIWICNWCKAESTTPVTLHRDLVAGARAHLDTCWPYLRHKINRESVIWALHQEVRRAPWEIKPR